VVCFDESPIQLIGEVRQPIPAAPGQIERYDCEYRRNGTANSAVKRVPRRSPFGEIIIRANCHSKDFQMAWYRTAACAPLARLDSEQSPM
jgi:hypothetical protein